MYKKDFTKKLQQYFAILVIVLLVFGIVYFIGSKIISVFSKPDAIELSNIEQYMDEKTIVMDYSQFYTLDSILEQWLDNVLEKKYSDIYDIMIPEYQKLYSKSEAKEILTDYCDNRLSDTKNDINYISSNKLAAAYLIDDIYILKFVDVDNKDMYLAVKFGDKNTYQFTFVEENNANKEV